MEKFLTDPELDSAKPAYVDNVMKRNLKTQFIEKECNTLKQRIEDMSTNLSINKQIIGALIDAA